MTDEEKRIVDDLLSHPFPPLSLLLPGERTEDGEELCINGTGVHLFRGSGKESTVILNAHGGGFLKGRSVRDIIWCRYAAEHTGCDVYDIDYALTPDNVFPVAVEQLASVAKELEKEHNVILAGHSSGANLALSATMFYGVEPVAILADYPPVDATRDFLKDVPPEKMDRAKVEKLYFDLYCGKTAHEDPRISLKYASKEAVSRLPETLFIVGEEDGLRNEVEAFAAFCFMKCKVYKDSPHGFTTNRYGAWREALDDQMAFIDRKKGETR